MVVLGPMKSAEARQPVGLYGLWRQHRTSFQARERAPQWQSGWASPQCGHAAPKGATPNCHRLLRPISLLVQWGSKIRSFFSRTGGLSPAANSRNSENFFSRMRHPVSFYRHYRRRSLLHHRPTQTIHFSFLTTFPSYAPNLTLRWVESRSWGDAMQRILETLAFSLVIGGQFFAALVSTAKRAVLYPDAKHQAHQSPCGDEIFEPLAAEAGQPANQNAPEPTRASVA
jgi:hypothetical protein